MNFGKITVLTLGFLFSFSFFGISQERFGNEWINYSQTYYKIKVFKTGIHRITHENLIDCGINLSNPSKLQLFKNGVEQPIYVHNNVEYIEFYGEKNDGSLDSLLYSNPSNLLNPYHSLYSDTSVYFLTSGTANGLRYNNVTANLVNLPQKELSFINEDLISFNQIWDSGTKYVFSGVAFNRSFYEIGEGWGSGEVFNFNCSHNLNTNLIDQIVDVEIKIAYVGNTNHSPTVKVNSNAEYTDFYSGETTKVIKFSTRINSRNLNISIIGNGEKYIVSYIKVRYEKEYNFNQNTSFEFNVKSDGHRKFLEIENFKNANSSQNIYLYDLTSKKRIHCFFSNSKVLTDLAPSNENKKLILVNSDDVNSYNIVLKMNEVRFTDYKNYSGDLLVIKHSKIQYYNERDLILEYAAHKSSQGFNPVIIDIEEVINQFGYGINNHPQSLRNLFNFANYNWNNLEYVFLIGKGRVYNEVRNFNTYDNMIPTFGHPASDNLFFSENGTIMQEVSVGRLSISTSEEFKNYFDKLVEMETENTKEWGKDVIHLVGGNNLNENVMFENALSTSRNIAEDLGYNVSTFSDINSNGNSFYDKINQGSVLVTYLGHANPMSLESYSDSIERYSNKSKYPFFISLSCRNGNYLQEGEQMSEKFVLAKDKGFVGYLGFSTDVALFSATAISNEIYNQLGVENISVGKILRNSITNLTTLSNGNILLEVAIHAMTLHGDPTYKIAKTPSTNDGVLSIKDSVIQEVETFITESHNDILIEVYPNPIVESLNIIFEKDKIDEIQIISLSGLVIKTFSNTKDMNNITWNIHDNNEILMPGLYYVLFKTENKVITKPIIVK